MYASVPNLEMEYAINVGTAILPAQLVIVIILPLDFLNNGKNALKTTISHPNNRELTHIRNSNSSKSIHLEGFPITINRYPFRWSFIYQYSSIIYYRPQF